MSRRKRGVRLEMTSLMDVMFLVLVFFIYCILDMTVHKGVKVQLPCAQGVLERGEQLVVTILADDSFQLNGVSMSRETLLAKIESLHKVNMDFPVILSGDKKASLGCGIELLGELKKLGIQKVSFQVQSPLER